MYDPLTGEEIQWTAGDPRRGVWNAGHKPEHQYRDIWRSYVDGQLAPQEFRDWDNNPSHYRPEFPSSNRSHKAEGIG